MMGFAPQQIDKMSLYQYAACVDGWNDANSGDAVDPPSADEFQSAKEAHGDI